MFPVLALDRSSFIATWRMLMPLAGSIGVAGFPYGPPGIGGSQQSGFASVTESWGVGLSDPYAPPGAKPGWLGVISSRWEKRIFFSSPGKLGMCPHDPVKAVFAQSLNPSSEPPQSLLRPPQIPRTHRAHLVSQGPIWGAPGLGVGVGS